MVASGLQAAASGMLAARAQREAAAWRMTWLAQKATLVLVHVCVPVYVQQRPATACAARLIHLYSFEIARALLTYLLF